MRPQPAGAPQLPGFLPDLASMPALSKTWANSSVIWTNLANGHGLTRKAADGHLLPTLRHQSSAGTSPGCSPTPSSRTSASANSTTSGAYSPCSTSPAANKARAPEPAVASDARRDEGSESASNAIIRGGPPRRLPRVHPQLPAATHMGAQRRGSGAWRRSGGGSSAGSTARGRPWRRTATSVAATIRWRVTT
jgi:hypothetical protein